MPTVQQDIHGPDWPLGFIEVVTPSTPVPIMSLVDSTYKNAPSAANGPGTTAREYTSRFNQLCFQGFHPLAGGATGFEINQGPVYIVRRQTATTWGTRNDGGCIVHILMPGETFYLAPTSLVKDVFSGYRYAIDADNALDGALVTGLIF